MLKLNTKFWSVLSLVLIGAMVFTGCKKDDDEPETETPVEDGLYITGGASAFSSPSLNGNFSVTRNEVFNDDYNSGAIAENDRPSLMECFAAISSTGNFSIKQISGSTTTTWGFGADLEVVAASSEADGPQVDFQRGSLVDGGTAITVPTDGLYHIILDTEANILIVTPVAYWGLIGAATPGGWSTDTQLMPSSFSTSSITYSITDVAITLSDYKLRHSGGWKINLDENYDNGTGVAAGLKINTNYGRTSSATDTPEDALVPGGGNYSNGVGGIYTVTMTWTPADGFVASLTKTDDLPLADYTSTELGLVGAGLNVAGVEHNWNETIFIGTPTVNGSVYTWTWNGVETNASGNGFKVREGQTWDDASFGIDAVTVTGSAAGDLGGTGDFIPSVDGGMYNMIFTIDASDESKTLNVEPA